MKLVDDEGNAADVTVLRWKPGDLVVLRFKEKLSVDHLSRIKWHLESVLKLYFGEEVKALVFDNDTEIEVLRKEES